SGVSFRERRKYIPVGSVPDVHVWHGLERTHLTERPRSPFFERLRGFPARGPFEAVKNRDVFHGAYRDVFTASSKGPLTGKSQSARRSLATSSCVGCGSASRLRRRRRRSRHESGR